MRGKVKFYLPERKRPKQDIPSEISEGYFRCLPYSFWNSSLAWNLQTYLRLQQNEYPCKLVDSLSEDGIIVVHRGDLPFDTIPSLSQLFVTTIGDAGWHPYAQVQVVQNRNHLNGVENTFLMHHWTQPGLIPRDEERGDVFKNVGYFGHPDQLADNLHDPEWERFLDERNLNWIPVHDDPDRQRDYSDIDLVVAIRSFDGRSYDYKPATKLHNAWLAGVPAILGPESAYRGERNHELDYLEASTYEELCRHVDRLNGQPSLRRKLRVRAEKRAKEISPERKAKDWWELLTGPVADIYDWWRSLSRMRQRFFIAKRWLRVKKEGMTERIGV